MLNLTMPELMKAAHSDLSQVATLGEVLKMLRCMNGLTQKSLGNMLCTCRQHVQKWEYDYYKPRPQTLKNILQIFNSERLYQPLIWQYYAGSTY